jgi:hypothetical protein
MTNPLSWSTTAASNTSVAGVSIAEGWAPASVNNAMRGMMADLSKYIKDSGGDLVTAGTGNNYTLASNMGLASYAKPLTLMAKTHITNTGPATLSVDVLGAKSIRRGNGATLAAGDLVLGGMYLFTYDPITDVFFVINPTGIGVINTTVPVAFGGTGLTTYAIGDLLYASAANVLGRLPAVADGNALLSGAMPAWGKIPLTTHVSGVLPISNGGTNAADVATAQANLGINIGTNVQPFDATLSGIAGLTTAASQTIYSTGVDTFAMTGLTAFGRSLIDDLDPSGAHTTLGLGTIAVQAASAVNITGGSIDATTLAVAGEAVPLRSLANAWTAAQTITLATAAAVPLTLTSTEAGAAAGPTLDLFRDSVSPFASDVIGGVKFTGRDSANALINYGSITASILDATAASTDGRLTVAAIIAGAPVTVAQFGPGLVVGAPAGGDKGVGTINATGVYDDNTLLTGYVLEAALDGRIDKPKWDKIGIRGVHEPMRRFSAMVETGSRNPLTIDGFGDFWKTYRHLPSLPDEEQPSLLEQPSTGQWIQMLVETVELLAVHLDGVHQRLERLEEEFGSGSDYSRA